MGKINLKKI